MILGQSEALGGCILQITINLPPDLEQDLIRQAKQSNVPLQALILQALHQMMQTQHTSSSHWSEVVLSYEGNPDFPALESYRNELLKPKEVELF